MLSVENNFLEKKKKKNYESENVVFLQGIIMNLSRCIGVAYLLISQTSGLLNTCDAYFFFPVPNHVWCIHLHCEMFGCLGLIIHI